MAEEAPAATGAGAVERRIVSVLFADLVGFTPLSERLDPEDVATIQDAYFGVVRDTIGRYGGVLEKFIGDAAMAIFGVPTGRDDDAERAVRAGLALIGAVEQLGARLGLAPDELQLRVGINSGEVVHAMGGPDAGRVTGDTVNTAARLQTAAPPNGVLLGQLTALLVAETIETEGSQPIAVKGKADPVRTAVAIGPRSRPSRDEALGALRAPLIGRSAELDRLRTAAAATAMAGTSARLLIVAPPGVGKSRLLNELAAAVSGTVLRGRVRPQATAPFETVAQLAASSPARDLRTVLADAGISSERATVIEVEMARLLGRGSATAPVSGADLAAEREARFDAWLTAIDALAPEAETWLVEDVHWAGADLLAFLEYAGRAPTRHGRLVVATARPSLLQTDPAWCETDRLDLAPLPAADAVSLVRALIGSSLPDALLAAIVERSDGTPLFIEELLRTWASVGTLVRRDEGWLLAMEPERVTLPPTVQAIYAAQLDDLPVDARQLARRGSVAGRRVPTGALPVLDLHPTRGLEALRRRALMTGPLRDPVTGDAYAYRHALLRDAGYASLGRAERATLHLAMAGWLESVAGAQVNVVAEAVAEHVASALESRPALASDALPSRATLAASAASWYERAAEAAVQLAAHGAGARLFRRSIDLTDADLPTDRARRRRRLGEVLAASADLDSGIAELEAALAAAPDDPSSVAASAYALGRAYMEQIRFHDAEALAASAIELLAGQEASLSARLHALHAAARAAQGREEGVIEEAELARAMARTAGDPFAELDVLDLTNTARDEVETSSDEEWALLEERARALGAWHHVVSAARVRAFLRATHDPTGALVDLERTGELALTHGYLELAGWCDYSRSELLFVVGRWDDALALGRSTIDLASRNAYERLAYRTYVALLPMAAARGDPSIARGFVSWRAASAQQLPAAPSAYARLLNAAADAWISDAEGEPPDAPPDETLAAIIPMLNPHVVVAIERVIGAWLATGRHDLARAGAEKADEFAADADATPLMRASAALVRAWVGLDEPDTAVVAARAAESPWWIARALRAAGREAEARTIEKALGLPAT